MIKNVLHRKKVAAVTIFTLALLLSTTCLAADYVSVKKDGVNIRSGPSTKNAILWEVFEGFPLKVLDTKGEWTQVVDFEGDKGWIYASLLNKESTVIVKVDTANMRSGPAKENSIIATVKKGVVFKPVDKKGNWIKVSYKGDISGWMYNTLLWPSNIK